MINPYNTIVILDFIGGIFNLILKQVSMQQENDTIEKLEKRILNLKSNFSNYNIIHCFPRWNGIGGSISKF